MLKKEIKYTDYNGVERKEDFYFNLTKAELMEWELSKQGGFSEIVKKIVETKDQPKLIELFKEVILKAYGEKSEDGKRFMKKDKNGTPLSNYFEETEAYSNLFIELSSDDKKAADFVAGIIPKDIDMNEVNKEIAKLNK